MSKLYEFVKEIINSKQEEANKLLYQNQALNSNTSEYYQMIISAFIAKKEQLIFKINNNNIEFNLDKHVDEVWNILFLSNYIINELESKLKIIRKLYNEELDKEKKAKYGKIIQELSNNISRLCTNKELSKVSITKTRDVSEIALTKLKEAIIILQKTRDSLCHGERKIEDGIIEINNARNNFIVNIPLDYIKQFNEGRIIVKEEDKVIIKRVNEISFSILEQYHLNPMGLNSFFYNVNPETLSYILDEVDNDVYKLYQLPSDLFFIDFERIKLIFKYAKYNKFSISELIILSEIYHNYTNEVFQKVLEYVYDEENNIKEINSNLILLNLHSIYHKEKINTFDTSEIDFKSKDETFEELEQKESFKAFPYPNFKRYILSLKGKRDDKKPLDFEFYIIKFISALFDEQTDTLKEICEICEKYQIDYNILIHNIYTFITHKDKLIKYIEYLKENSISYEYLTDIIEFNKNDKDFNFSLLKPLISICKSNNIDISDILEIEKINTNRVEDLITLINNKEKYGLSIEDIKEIDFSEKFNINEFLKILEFYQKNGVKSKLAIIAYNFNKEDAIERLKLYIDHNYPLDNLNHINSDRLELKLLIFSKKDFEKALEILAICEKYGYTFIDFTKLNIDVNEKSILEKMEMLLKYIKENNKNKDLSIYSLKNSQTEYDDCGLSSIFDYVSFFNEEGIKYDLSLFDKDFLDTKRKKDNFKHLLNASEYNIRQIINYPSEVFNCDITICDELVSKYNSNVLRSIFGINNPKIIAILIYINSTYSKYTKDKLENEDIINKDLSERMLANAKFYEEESSLNNLTRHIRNASMHFRYKDTGNNEIYLYDENSKGNIVFELTVKLTDLLEFTNEFEKINGVSKKRS